MVRIFISAVFCLFATTGCTSHSWTQKTCRYDATYREVFERLPKEAKQHGMSVKKSMPQAGLIVFNTHRIIDQLFTGSLINMVAGDEVIVKVKRIDPVTTEVFIDSKAHGQVGPDLGRTDRNVRTLANTLDLVWPRVDPSREQKGEKRVAMLAATETGGS